MKVAPQLQSTRSSIGTERLASRQVSQFVVPSQPGIGCRQVAQRKTSQQDDRSSAGKPLTAERTNQEWLADLRGPQQAEALAELRHILLKGLGYALAGYGNVRDADLDDFVQETLLRILAMLDTFRGESRFTTWAQKIAVHGALTELRRKRWQDVSLDQLTAGDMGTEIIPHFLADPSAGPERQAMQQILLDHLERVIAEELTERQRRALLAVYIHGVPLGKMARRMGTNPNAIYKLLHDARKRLKERMLHHGISAQEMLAFFAGE
jgi:RNA polymerase sigma-70 factor (ECF subfamily)